MTDILRQEGESDFDWKLRLIVAKIDKELDLDWQEIRDILDLDCSPDHLRKTAYGLYEYDSNLKQNKIDSLNNDIVKDFEDKRLQAQKEKFLLQDQRREYNKLIRDQARFEHIQDEIIRSVKDLAAQKPLFWNRPKVTFTKSTKEAVVLFSDWHKGLFANNHWNYFDNEEFNKRVSRLTHKTIEYGKLHDTKILHVFILGDMVNGLIHVTSRINAVEDVITQTQSVSETLSEVLCEFASQFEQVKVYNVRGNHDRITPNKSDEIARESFADIIPWYLKARLSHIGNICFVENTLDDEITYTEICGQKIFALHGHRDRPSSVIKDLSLMTKIVPDYVFMGHFHHHEENEEHGVELIINSSLSGVDSYAKEIRKTGKPAQKLIIFDEIEKRLATYNIRLDL